MPSKRSIARFAARLAARAALALPLAVAASCGTSSTDAGTPPTMAEVAGDYQATQLTGGGYDVLALGGSLDLTLGADGSLAGRLVIPPAAGGPLDEDMAGTYTLTGNTLTFDQAADTFVRDATWTWSSGVITGTWTGGGTSASVRLER